MLKETVRALGGPKSLPPFRGTETGFHEVCNGGTSQVLVELAPVFPGDLITACSAKDDWENRRAFQRSSSGIDLNWYIRAAEAADIGASSAIGQPWM
ncbi:hypothetical protein FRC09_002936, partial [Ceratobasidium sp. 395]